MAKTNDSFDELFREKLDGHREKPSALAWERLENQLPKASGSRKGIWWAAAASVVTLLTVSFLIWSESSKSEKGEFLADQTDSQNKVDAEQIQKEESQPEVILPAEEKQVAIEENTTSVEKISPKKSVRNQTTKPTPAPTFSPNPSQLIAEAEPIQPKAITEVAPIQTEEPKPVFVEPQAKPLEKAVAMTEAPAADEPLYRVSIYSNGVKKTEPAPKNLINELGKTVGQVEGLLGKVDEGMFTIQDKKENLFANLTSKK